MARHDAVLGETEFQHLQDEDGKDDAAHARYCGKEDALGDDLGEDDTRCGTDGATDANLGGALLDGDHHDVGHTDGSGQQCADAHEPDEQIHAGEEAVNQPEEHLGIEHHHGFLVGGVDVVGSGYDLSDAGGDVADGCAAAGCDGYHLYVVTHVECPLHQG